MSRPLTAQDRETVIGFELAHLGMGETPPGSNNTVPGAWYGLNYQPWCAMFQSWSFYSVLGFSPFPATFSKGFASCMAGAQWFRRQGKWASSEATPLRGWLIFFGSPEHHVGVVLSADRPRNIDTCEGNWSDRVVLGHRQSNIAGYGVIDYGAPEPSPHPLPAPALPPFTRTLHPGQPTTHDEIRIILRFQQLLKWQSVRHHAPDQDPGLIDGQYGPRTAAAYLAFERGVNAALVHTHQKPWWDPVSTGLGPRGLGMLTWWASRP